MVAIHFILSVQQQQESGLHLLHKMVDWMTIDNSTQKNRKNETKNPPSFKKLVLTN